MTLLPAMARQNGRSPFGGMDRLSLCIGYSRFWVSLRFPVDRA
jgi:hypothetical protein